MATWNKLNIDSATLSSNSTGTAQKSMYIGARTINGVAKPIASIYSGDVSVIDDPVVNAKKIFFHTSFDYLRIKKTVTVTLTIPSRDVRPYTGGKKSGGGKISYNGYADYYVHKHSYGDPPPAFTVSLTNDASNGALTGHALTGSIPLQYMTSNSFRLALCYSTSEYLCIRERYQVYDTTIPQLTLKLQIHYFENPLGFIGTQESYNIIHSPLLLTASVPVTGAARSIEQSVQFTSVDSTQTFNRVTITRIRGGPDVHKITNLNGTPVTPFDPITEYVYDLPGLTTSFTMSVKTSILTNAYRSFNFTYEVKFTNTILNRSKIDYIGGIHTFQG
jgi:hypothetical protein